LALDHARSPEEASARLDQTTYDLLLCEYKSGDSDGLRLLHEVRKDGQGPPVIFLSDHVDEATVNAALKAGHGDFVRTPNPDEPSVKPTIRYAIDVYCKERQRQKAEDTLRKLWRAVEQSADMVMITDRAGLIEYVNPAFEVLTGYSRAEVIGRNPKILKST
jgi:CheY-like chemotaxis protein